MLHPNAYPFTEIDHPATSYVIIDLEWNQPIPWIKTDIDPKELPGEIIEIGAVKLSLTERGYQLSKPFHVTIRPSHYTVMNKNVSRVTNKMSSDLKFGIRFPDAYDAFRVWCGEDYILCGWGNSDLSILKANLRLHKMEPILNTLFLDVQPLFARIAEGVTNQRSVEYAVDFLHIPKHDDFHAAHRDAEYTGHILRELLLLLDTAKMTEKTGQRRRPTDIPFDQLVTFKIRPYLQNPDLHAETTRRSEAFTTWPACFEHEARPGERCPACDRELDTDIPWFRLKKSGFSLWYCEEHHMVQGRMRMKKTPEGKFFAAVSLRLVDPGSARLIVEREEEFLTYGVEGKPFVPEVVPEITLDIPQEQGELPETPVI